jgi:hypothetical protein
MFFSLRRLPCLTSRSYKKYYFMHSLHNSYLHYKCGRLHFTVSGKFLQYSCSKSNARNQLLENEIARL